MMITINITSSTIPNPIIVYANKSSLIAGLRAVPTTKAANTDPIPILTRF